MAINQALLGEFDHEMANTRKSLERVPEGKFDWKPHTKSMSMGALAAHIAMIPHWGKMTLETPSFDVNPPGGQQVRQPELKTKAEILAFFDKGVPEVRAAIAGASDQIADDAVVALQWRQDDFHDASHGRVARHDHEPHDSSSRAAGRLSAAQ